MAITPTDYARKVKLTGLSPSASLSGVPFVITEANLPAEIWALAENGGGDLRICVDEAGTDQLALDVVSFDTVAETAELWTQFATYTSVARECWLFYDKAGDTQPAVGAAFGRNAANSIYDFKAHFRGSDRTIDSTGTYTLAESGTITTVTGAVGEGASAGENLSNFLTVTTYKGISGAGARTHRTWVKTSSTNDVGFLGYGFNNTGMRWEQRFNNGPLRAEIQGSFIETTANFNDGVWHYVVTVADGTSTFPGCATMYVDGVAVAVTTGSNVTLNTDITTPQDVVTKQAVSATGFPNDEFDEYSMSAVATSADQVATEYSNQFNPAAFWTTGTPQSTAGGVTLTPETGTFTYSGGAVNLTVNRVLTPETATFNYSGGAISLSRGYFLSPETASFSYSGGVVGLIVDRVLSPETGTFTYSGASVDLLVGRLITPETGIFSYSGGSVDLVYSAAGGVTLNPETGTFSYSGGDVQLTIGRAITPDTGVFSYAGPELSLLADRGLTPEPGSFAYSGGSLNLLANRSLTPETGAFSYSGGAITFVYSGEVVRLVSTYSVNYAEDMITGSYGVDNAAGNYETDSITGTYQGIE